MLSEQKCKNVLSETGNRTPVSRVTGGDTSHYTIADKEVERSQIWTDDFRVWNPMLYQLSYTSKLVVSQWGTEIAGQKKHYEQS